MLVWLVCLFVRWIYILYVLVVNIWFVHIHHMTFSPSIPAYLTSQTLLAGWYCWEISKCEGYALWVPGVELTYKQLNLTHKYTGSLRHGTIHLQDFCTPCNCSWYITRAYVAYQRFSCWSRRQVYRFTIKILRERVIIYLILKVVVLMLDLQYTLIQTILL